MTFKLASRSITRLQQCHPDLRRVVEHAITITPIDFTVTETLRTLKHQKELVAIGASKTLDSRHLAHPSDGLSRAVDLAALLNGKVRWDGPLYYEISEAMQKAAKACNVVITWGGVFDRRLNDLGEDLEVEVMEYIARRKALEKKAFVDACHWELNREAYP